MKDRLKKWTAVLPGSFLFLSGALTFWLPIPIGLPLMLLGLPLLLNASTRIKIFFLRITRNYPAIRKVLKKMIRKEKIESVSKTREDL